MPAMPPHESHHTTPLLSQCCVNKKTNGVPLGVLLRRALQIPYRRRLTKHAANACVPWLSWLQMAES
jgi:hypothetical protein